MDNKEFFKAIDEIRQNDKENGTGIAQAALKILQALAYYGSPAADPGDIKTGRMAALAGLCDLAAACESYHILAKTQDFLIIEQAKENRRRQHRKASETLMFTFMRKWADDLEASGQARSRAEAVLMAAEAYSDLSQRAAGQDTGGF